MARGLLYALMAGLALGSMSCGALAPRRSIGGPAAVEGEILFRYFDPTARRVQLAGDWPENNWARGDGSAGEADIGLMQSKDGVWEIRVALPPGRYQYLFWVDELTWHTDPWNPEEVEGGPAGLCSQLIVYRQATQLEVR
jgi:1,4-alpha-glucan branching enzyme